MMNWNNQIDKTTEEFLNLFGPLTSEQLNWKPNSSTWSIAQNIDHLIVVNQSYFPILNDLKTGSYNLPFIGKIGFVTSLLVKLLLNSVQADRKKKIKTFPIWEPTESKISGDILERFVNHQNELKKQINDSSDLILKGTVISSPANRNIVYKLETAFDIIVAHEQRHLEQAKVVFELQKKNVGNGTKI